MQVLRAHGAVMEPVQVDAFSVDLFKPIALVSGLLHVASGVNANRRSGVFNIHQFSWKSDADAMIIRNFHSDRVAHLNRIAADFRKFIAQDLPIMITRRKVPRMGPNAVAANVPERRIGHRKLLGSFFQQDAAGRIVASFGVARPAVFHRHVIDRDILGMADDRREIRDVGEIDMIDGQTVGVLDQNTVVAEHARKRFIGRREGQRLFKRRAIAIDRKIGEPNVRRQPWQLKMARP